jgi:hypothetical protein
MSIPPPKLLFCFLGRLGGRALFLPLRLARSPTRNVIADLEHTNVPHHL